MSLRHGNILRYIIKRFPLRESPFIFDLRAYYDSSLCQHGGSDHRQSRRNTIPPQDQQKIHRHYRVGVGSYYRRYRDNERGEIAELPLPCDMYGGGHSPWDSA